jgi:hypothetical protein
LAWIEVHEGLLRHRKTTALAEALDVHRTSAAGHIIGLWLWALGNAPEGDLHPISTRAIAIGADWEGDPDTFMDALITAGFVDPDGKIHDWYAYAGRLIERRAKDAERKRTERVSTGRPTDVQRTVQRTSTPTVPNPTVPNPTVPNPKKSNLSVTPRKVTGKEKPKPVTPEFIEALVEEFSPVLGGVAGVREVIEDAMNHTAMDKRKDKRLYLKGWLRRNAERNGSQPTTRTPLSGPARHAKFTKLAEEFNQ